MHNSARCIWGVVAAALVSSSVADAIARDEQSSDTNASVAKRGEREAKDITYGDWQKLCFKAAGAPRLCRTSITGKFPTGQTAVRVDLIEREDSRTARLQMFVPVGMYLKHPVKLTVDGGNPHQVPYSWCLTNACIAGTVADPKFVKTMEAGKSLTLEVVDSNLLALTTSLPLAQFAAVHKGAPAMTMEQDIDE
ncbi:invasion associated locus B family protein [Bradyrhizobium japonicum]|uniref:invasion associated locus B family protein n=1 Tax=Bradyrhizobium japonicum TaxID=375 RepID=UPI001BA85168|nr:invasion associated locus B family protein [Bradyrhizobium japonicum]MBR0962025.1 invasion associated locus B family protein [Bradyrhizobium japonicum]